MQPLRPRTPRITTVSIPQSPPTTSLSSLISTTPTINAFKRSDWDTDNHNELLEQACNETIFGSPKEEIVKVNILNNQNDIVRVDPPGLNTVELDRAKYEHQTV